MYPSSAWLASPNRERNPEWEAALGQTPRPLDFTREFPRRYPRQSSLSLANSLPRIAEEASPNQHVRRPSFNPNASTFTPAMPGNTSGSNMSRNETTSPERHNAGQPNGGGQQQWYNHNNMPQNEPQEMRATTPNFLDQSGRPIFPLRFGQGQHSSNMQGNNIPQPRSENPQGKKNVGVIGGERILRRGGHPDKHL